MTFEGPFQPRLFCDSMTLLRFLENCRTLVPTAQGSIPHRVGQDLWHQQRRVPRGWGFAGGRWISDEFCLSTKNEAYFGVKVPQRVGVWLPIRVRGGWRGAQMVMYNLQTPERWLR